MTLDAETLTLYVSQEGDFGFSVTALPHKPRVTVLVIHGPTNRYAYREFGRQQWLSFGYDTQQGVWSSLCWRVMHQEENTHEH